MDTPPSRPPEPFDPHPDEPGAPLPPIGDDGAWLVSRPAVVAAAGVLVLVLGAAIVGLAHGGGGTDRSGTPVGSAVTLGPAPSSSAPSESPSPPPPPRAVTITGVGDVIMGSTPALPPDGGAAFFDPVAGELTGDVVVGNLEGPLTDHSVSTKCEPDSERCFAFRTPPAYARWLAEAHFTVMNLANNHSRDFGTVGLRDTQAALSRFGLSHTGLPGEVTVREAGGSTVAVLGFSPYSWSQSLLDIPGAQALVRGAAERADLVVVVMHAGAEGADQTHVRPGTETFLGENRGDPVAFAHAVVDAGAHLVIGHGPHVLRGMEWYKGKLIAYSLGNFAGYEALSTEGVLGVGAILRASLRPDGTWEGGRVVPTHLVGAGTPALDPAGRARDMINSLSREDFGRCGAQVSAAGEFAPPTC